MNDEQVTQLDNTQIIYQQDKATIDMQISTAKAYPRDMDRSIKNAITTVTLDKETAASCNYSLPRGNKSISGPSVHLAKILAQTWGNMRVEAKIVEIGDKTITSQAVAFDLENNLAIKVEVKRKITDKTGRRFNEDMITVTGNAANAISLRNAILAVIPKGVVDKVYKSALNTLTGDLTDEAQFLKQKAQIFKAFKDKYGVNEEEVLRVIGKTSQDQMTQEDLVTLIGIGQALKDGDTTVEETFREKATATIYTIDEIKSLYESVKDNLSGAEIKNAERIINNKEEQSYTKLFKSLNERVNNKE